MDDNDIVAVPLKKTAEEFFAQSDSVYLRIQYVPENEGFRFEVWNQFYHSLTEQEKAEYNSENYRNYEHMVFLVRGLAEAAMQYPGDIYQMGIQAQNRDAVYMDENIPEDQKALLIAEPKGRA